MKDKTMHNYFEYLDIYCPIEEIIINETKFFTIKRAEKIPNYQQWEKQNECH